MYLFLMWVFHSTERDQWCSAPPKPEASGDASPPKTDAEQPSEIGGD